jgi:hypothetical protein
MDDLKYGQISFKTTSAAQDADVMMLFAYEKPIRLVEAHIMFTELDSFGSGVDIDIETDDGSTEAVVASYDTVGGGSATAVNTLYEFTFSDAAVIDKDEWFQIRVHDDENAACGFAVTFAYVELEALPD